ncbi:MAG: hypothetical protein U0325_02560 [Polyangiales bacterium]
MPTLRHALRTPLLLAASIGCASTPPTSPTTPPAAPAAPTATTDAARDASTGRAATTPPEPPCPSGQGGAVRSYVCGDPRPDETPGGFDAPNARCPATRGGLGFSAAQTAQRRGQVESSQTCCYLERCQAPLIY